MEVLRRSYLERLKSGKDRTDAVKVITGMRRSGKTVLMKQYMQSLKDSGIPDDEIVYINLESRENAGITNYIDLLNRIDESYKGKRIYVFIDEIQMVVSWERAINSLQVDYDADVYITGSNAYLLSSEISTYISGRYVELRILPLSFSEYIELHPGDRGLRFKQYLRYGSLPFIDPEADEQFEHDHLIGIFNTVLMKDVVGHCNADNASILYDISRFLFSNIGNVTSCNNIAETLGIDKRKVRTYIDALQDAFLIYKAKRYDIRGKKLLDTLEKYYVSDTGMRNSVLGISSRKDDSRLIENIVYLELIRRGYEVSVGKYGDLEVDFTARKGDKIEYYQVALSMLSEEVYAREMRPLNLIRDNYRKIVLSLDSFITDIPDGIEHINLLDWLCG